jgi:hypothetical protein
MLIILRCQAAAAMRGRTGGRRNHPSCRAHGPCCVPAPTGWRNTKPTMARFGRRCSPPRGILGMADRILVMREGRIVGELSAAEASEEAVMAFATGHEAMLQRAREPV